MPTIDLFQSAISGSSGAPCLTLHDQPLGDTGAALLAGSEWPSRLHALHLCGCQIGLKEVQMLARASWPHLHTLDLTSNPLGNGGAEVLASSAAFTELRCLKLNATEIGSAGAKALAASTTLSKLQELSLRLNQLQGDAVGAFGLACLPQLTSLELSASPSVLEAAELLAGPGMPQLSRLVLDGRLLQGEQLRRARRRGTLPVKGGNGVERALLDAVRDDPDDDAVRLIYADWIEDEGETERAEFIRIQIEAERLPPADGRRTLLELRAGELYRLHGQDWIEPALLLLRWLRAEDLRYWRGFPHELTANLGMSREQLSWALELYPIQMLRNRLSDWPADIPDLLSQPRLGQLRSLTPRPLKEA